jgi:hypothetical protein
LEECITGDTITSDGFVDPVLDGLHDRSRFCLGPLAFARKLDIVKRDESATNASCPAEVVERILKLPKSKFLLAADYTGYAK